MSWDSEFKEQWDWQEQKYQEIIQILQRHLSYIVSIRVADKEEDTRQATDMVIEVETGTVCVRIRSHGSHKDKYRGLTIRTKSAGNGKTEIHKLREGFGKYYFYAWADESDVLAEWVLIDIDKVRDAGLLDEPVCQIPNRDGCTRFMEISMNQLRAAGAILVITKIFYRGVPIEVKGVPQADVDYERDPCPPRQLVVQ